MTSPSTDQAQQLLSHLQAWRQYLERAVGAMAPTQYVPPPGWGMSVAPPPAPFMPPPMPVAMATPQTDYAQQLIACLQAWRQYLEQMGATAAGQPGPATSPPPATSAQPDPVADGAPVDPTPGRARSASTPQAQEYVVPEHGFMSDIAFMKLPEHHEGEPFSGSGSLYNPSRSTLSSSPLAEFQPNSAYVSAHSASSTGLVSAAQESLYSSFATPTARGQQQKAVPSSRPEGLEVIGPLIEGSK